MTEHVGRTKPAVMKAQDSSGVVMDAILGLLKGLGITPENIAGLIAKQIVEGGLPPKVLLTPSEAAWALGFTERAFEQSDWRKEIPVVKIGIKNYYRLKDLEDFAQNHLMLPLRRVQSD